MTQPRFEFQAEGEKVTFWLRVQPRARRERLMADPQGRLRLQVTAPPAEGRANEACVRYLARSLRLPASAPANRLPAPIQEQSSVATRTGTDNRRPATRKSADVFTFRACRMPTASITASIASNTTP